MTWEEDKGQEIVHPQTTQSSQSLGATQPPYLQEFVLRSFNISLRCVGDASWPYDINAPTGLECFCWAFPIFET
jgi:hypothetical protein